MGKMKIETLRARYGHLPKWQQPDELLTDAEQAARKFWAHASGLPLLLNEFDADVFFAMTANHDAVWGDNAEDTLGHILSVLAVTFSALAAAHKRYGAVDGQTA